MNRSLKKFVALLVGACLAGQGTEVPRPASRVRSPALEVPSRASVHSSRDPGRRTRDGFTAQALSLPPVFTGNRPAPGAAHVISETIPDRPPVKNETRETAIQDLAESSFRLVRYVHENRFAAILFSGRSTGVSQEFFDAAWDALFPDDPKPVIFILTHRENQALYDLGDLDGNPLRARIREVLDEKMSSRPDAKARLGNYKNQKLCLIDECVIGGLKYTEFSERFPHLGYTHMHFAYFAYFPLSQVPVRPHDFPGVQKEAAAYLMWNLAGSERASVDPGGHILPDDLKRIPERKDIRGRILTEIFSAAPSPAQALARAIKGLDYEQADMAQAAGVHPDTVRHFLSDPESVGPASWGKLSEAFPLLRAAGSLPELRRLIQAVLDLGYQKGDIGWRAGGIKASAIAWILSGGNTDFANRQKLLRAALELRVLGLPSVGLPELRQALQAALNLDFSAGEIGEEAGGVDRKVILHILSGGGAGLAMQQVLFSAAKRLQSLGSMDDLSYALQALQKSGYSLVDIGREAGWISATTVHSVLKGAGATLRNRRALVEACQRLQNLAPLPAGARERTWEVGVARPALSGDPVPLAVRVYRDLQGRQRVDGSTIPEGLTRQFLEIARDPRWRGCLWIMGGAVRDLLLGRLPFDLDYFSEVQRPYPSDLQTALHDLWQSSGWRIAHMGSAASFPWDLPELSINRMMLGFEDGGDPILVDRQGGYEDLRNRRARLVGDDPQPFSIPFSRVIEKIIRLGLASTAETSQAILEFDRWYRKSIVEVMIPPERPTPTDRERFASLAVYRRWHALLADPSPKRVTSLWHAIEKWNRLKNEPDFLKRLGLETPADRARLSGA